jgi:hypothetical protein
MLPGFMIHANISQYVFELPHYTVFILEFVGYFHAKVLDVDGLQSATHNTQEDKELCLPDTV